MSRTEFARINAEQAKAGEPPYKNARNLTAGTLKQLDPKVTATRKMSFFGYGTGATDGVLIKTQQQLFDTLRAFGFPVNPHEKLCKSMDEVIAYCGEWDKKRSDFLPSDGDRDYIESLMQPEVEPGKFASWISPPKVGIDNKPGDFEYVKLA